LGSVGKLMGKRRVLTFLTQQHLIASTPASLSRALRYVINVWNCVEAHSKSPPVVCAELVGIWSPGVLLIAIVLVPVKNIPLWIFENHEKYSEET